MISSVDDKVPVAPGDAEAVDAAAEIYRSPKRARRKPAAADASPEPVIAVPAEPVANTSTVVAASGSALPAEELERLTADIVAALKTVYDPEIPADIYELGLIYKVDVDDDRNVKVDMTLTSPGCPVAGEMPIWVQNAVGAVAGVNDVEVEIVFDPPWDKERMSEEAKLALNMF